MNFNTHTSMLLMHLKHA